MKTHPLYLLIDLPEEGLLGVGAAGVVEEGGQEPHAIEGGLGRGAAIQHTRVPLGSRLIAQKKKNAPNHMKS